MKCILLIWAVLAGHRSGQTIGGDLVDAVSGAPVAGAHVSIGTAGNSRTMTVSDTAGQFQLSAWGAARQFGVSGGYGVWISRPGYLPRQHVVAMGSINERIKVIPQVVISGR